MFSRTGEVSQHIQVKTVQEQFPIKAGQLSSVPYSASEHGRSNTSSRIRGRIDHFED
jgi:hypothetical protein